MMSCTFFGHRDAPNKIEPMLRSVLIDLIKNNNVRNFFVGNQGNFDHMVKRTLIDLKEVYPIEYAVVLAYLPNKKNNAFKDSSDCTIIPDKIEMVPQKFAICYRNKWMIEQSDYVVTYVKYSIGGASQFKELAEKKKKTVINLAT